MQSHTACSRTTGTQCFVLCTSMPYFVLKIPLTYYSQPIEPCSIPENTLHRPPPGLQEELSLRARAPWP